MVFLGVYVPTVGLGFVLDDFGWVLNSRVRGLSDFIRILTTADGFYRPAVTLTFTNNELLFGAQPRGYGLTNVLLALACGLAIARLARDLKLPPGAAWLAAMLWLLNFHGINMAVLWISGRTALMLTLAATLCASALLRGQLWLAILWLALALLSKEEAVVLPLVLAAWLRIHARAGNELRNTTNTRTSLSDESQNTRNIRISLDVMWIVLAAAAVGLYLTTRSFAGAMTPASAPYYYRFTVDPGVLWKNLLEYADRALTVSVAVTILAAIILKPPNWQLDSRTRRRWLVASCGSRGGTRSRSFCQCDPASIRVCRRWAHASRRRRFARACGRWPLDTADVTRSLRQPLCRCS